MLLDTSIRGRGEELVFRDQGLLEYSTAIFRSQLHTSVSSKISVRPHENKTLYSSLWLAGKITSALKESEGATLETRRDFEIS